MRILGRRMKQAARAAAYAMLAMSAVVPATVNGVDCSHCFPDDPVVAFSSSNPPPGKCRGHGNPLASVTCGAPAIEFAVLVPFTLDKFADTAANVATWSNRALWPCALPERGAGAQGSKDEVGSVAHHTDLVFYVASKEKPSARWAQARMHLLEALEPVRSCFAEVIFRSAEVDLASADAVGTDVASAMFYGAFDRRQLRLHAYDYMYYMVPGTRPVRAGWVENLYQEAAVRHPFWMRGPVAPVRGSARAVMPHIGGGALFRFSDPGFHRYICDSQGAFRDRPDFARSLQVHRESRGLSNLLPLFSFTESIQDHGQERIDLDTFLRENPRTILVRGGGLPAAIERRFPSTARAATHRLSQGQGQGQGQSSKHRQREDSSSSQPTLSRMADLCRASRVSTRSSRSKD